MLRLRPTALAKRQNASPGRNGVAAAPPAPEVAKPLTPLKCPSPRPSVALATPPSLRRLLKTRPLPPYTGGRRRGLTVGPKLALWQFALVAMSCPPAAQLVAVGLAPPRPARPLAVGRPLVQGLAVARPVPFSALTAPTLLRVVVRTADTAAADARPLFGCLGSRSHQPLP